MKTFYFSAIITLISALTMLGANTIQHEETHKAIYAGYDINATIEYYPIKGFTNGIFGTTKAYISKDECPEDCRLAHNYNEIIGYNVNTITVSIFVVFFLWLFVTETRRIESE